MRRRRDEELYGAFDEQEDALSLEAILANPYEGKKVKRHFDQKDVYDFKLQDTIDLKILEKKYGLTLPFKFTTASKLKRIMEINFEAPVLLTQKILKNKKTVEMVEASMGEVNDAPQSSMYIQP